MVFRQVFKNWLSEEDLHAIMNQMEVPMSMKAAELADLIVERKAKAEQRSYESLKSKVVSATTKMTADLEYSTELTMSDDDMLALTRVTEGLRELGYKFRFIEVQDTAGNVIKHKLHISIQHLI